MSNARAASPRVRFTDLPCEIKDGELHFAPPEEFVEMLNKLPAADEQN